MRSVVVFPHPEGPSSEKNSPRRIDRLRSSTATVDAEALGHALEADRFLAGTITAVRGEGGRVGGRVVRGHAASLPISTFSSSWRPSRRGSATAKATIRNEITSIKVPIALIVGLTPKRIEE